MFYGKPLDVENLKEEIGDALWYLAILCRGLNVDLGDMGAQVIEKLKKRYPDKYTDEAAQARADKVEWSGLTVINKSEESQDDLSDRDAN